MRAALVTDILRIDASVAGATVVQVLAFRPRAAACAARMAFRLRTVLMFTLHCLLMLIRSLPIFVRRLPAALCLRHENAPCRTIEQV